MNKLSGILVSVFPFVFFWGYQNYIGLKLGVYLGVKTCEYCLCFLAIVKVRVHYVDSFISFVLRY